MSSQPKIKTIHFISFHKASPSWLGRPARKKQRPKHWNWQYIHKNLITHFFITQAAAIRINTSVQHRVPSDRLPQRVQTIREIFLTIPLFNDWQSGYHKVPAIPHHLGSFRDTSMLPGGAAVQVYCGVAVIVRTSAPKQPLICLLWLLPHGEWAQKHKQCDLEATVSFQLRFSSYQIF